MSLLWHSALLFANHLSLPVLAFAIPLTPPGRFKVLQRDSKSCPIAGYSRCEDPQAPPNFCCPPNTVCITLNTAASMICCPVGTNCFNSTRNTCDPRAYDPDLNPQALAKTRRPDIEVPKCGNKCCAPGARCKADDSGSLYCQIGYPNLAVPPFPEGKGRTPPTPLLPSQTGAQSQSELPPQTQTTPTSPSSNPTTDQPGIIPISDLGQKPTSTSTATPNINHADSSLSPPTESKFPPLAIVVGLVAGLVAGIIIALIVLYFYKRRQANRFVPSPMSKFSHFREKSYDKGVVSISDPIPSTAQDSVRTDFLRRQAGLVKEDDRISKSKFRRTSARVKSFFGPRPTAEDIATMPTSNTASNREGGGGNRAGGGAGGSGREPSTESITVFSPAHLRPGQGGELYPGVGHGRPQTTFSEMMEKVGFQSKSGSPYFSVTATPPLPQIRTPQGRV
ncbi:hypothetical protein AJ78_03017 [Emergomyces pasteurianus Ep9510]|uniref:Mid2 domain-containing protein n=1 Tax=Emergomyces pasteurianus Ep9510 TaxID=1447872 RepID=A0A1J9Q9B0_9EURO|nr:hypothetical protein AJ78_03017 [Emergomyces pasteurianus Ep9510]